MLCPYRPFSESLFIFTLFLLPITKAVSNDLSRQVNQMQAQIMEANEKIATFAADFQRNAETVIALQTGLNKAHQEISDLKKNAILKHNQLVAMNAASHRTANGHGR